MKLAVSGQALAETQPLESILASAKELGINAFELWPKNAPAVSAARAQDVRYEGRDVERVGNVLCKFGMELACVSVDGAFNEEMMQNLKDYSASLCHAVEMASSLDCRLVNHYCYALSMGFQPDMNRLRDVWGPAIEKAAALNVTLVLENEAHDTTRTPEGMLAILSAVNHPNFRTNYDACNYYHASQEGFPYAYDLLKPYIAYVHLKNGCIFNAAAGHFADHKGHPFTGEHAGHNIYYPTMSEGAVNIGGLVSRLREDGYEGHTTFEPHTTPEHVIRYWTTDKEYLVAQGYFAKEQS